MILSVAGEIVEEPEIPRRQDRGKWIIGSAAAAVIIVAIVIMAIVYFQPAPEPENLPPQANASSDKTLAEVGEQVVFNASASTDLDGEIVEFSWDFGDGDQGEGVEITHSFTDPGAYIVYLEVTDNRGDVGTNEVSLLYIDVLSPTIPKGNASAPTAIATSDSNVIEEETQVSFDAASSWGWKWNPDKGDFDSTPTAITAFAWDFGDGDTSNEAAPNHTYSSSGNYVAKLTVTAENGRTASFIRTVHVLQEPEVFEGRVPNPDIFVEARLDEPRSFDPAHSHTTWDEPIILNTMETLVYYDRDRIDSLIPVLATEVPSVANGLISTDGLNYTFNIRQGIDFHDGSELTAYDIEYSIERVLVMSIPDGLFWILADPLTEFNQSRSAIEDAVTVEDTYTVTFHLKHVDATFLQRMASWPARIVSKDYVIAHGGWNPDIPASWQEWNGKIDEWMAKHIMGTGPFKLVKWDEGVQVVLEANEDYRLGAPNFKTIVIKRVSELSTRMLMLQAGDIDHTELPITQLPTLQQMAGITIFSGKATTRVDFVGFTWQINMTNQPPGTTINSTFFQDDHVRRGFAHAFPYEAYIDAAFSGNGIRARWFIPKGMFGYDESIPLYDYDLDKAKQEFQQAWGGVVWENGFRFTLYQWGGEESRIGAEMIKENIESLNPNFHIDIASPPWSIYLSKWMNRELPMAFGYIFALFADPQAYVGWILGSGGPAYSWQGYTNTTVGDVVAQAGIELDPVKRQALLSEVQQALHDDLIYLVLVEPGNFDIFRSWVRGYFYNPMHGPDNINYYTLSKG
ncbi:MAG: ABC transporter substrate-binding protein [Thermoplasmata archaeon]